MRITGNVQDTVLKAPLQYATVMVLRLKDSLLINFTRTDAKGHFEFKNLNMDTVVVLISNPRFNDQTIYVLGSTTNNNFDFGNVVMPIKSQQLNEVVIYAYKDPVYYKGDTLIYTADSFKVKPNATVEDLLKKLPGIKVDAQGKITSQGKEVTQVLVDGDEFFGSDPTVATKNLAANGVESVQVYEKKNENSTDGTDETTQVMNLQLKEEAKKGYFGKVSGASDFQNFYEGELLANKFKGPQKISVFALASNTPRSQFGWGDQYKYGLDNETNRQTDDDGNTFWYDDGNQNKGVPQTLKSGIYYNDKLGKKTKLGLNYTYNNNQLKANGATKSQYFLSDTSYTTYTESENNQKSDGHSINLRLTQTLDSLTELVIEPKVKLNSSQQDNSQVTQFLTSKDTITHITNIENGNKASGYSINTNVLLTRKFKNRDRLFTVNYSLNADDNQSKGILKSTNKFYNTNDSVFEINQQKINAWTSQTHNAVARFTNPFTKKIKMEFEYTYNYNLGKQNKKTEDYANGEYSAHNDSLSNIFENTRITNRLGFKFIYETKKQSFNTGARFRNVDIINSNLIAQTQIKQSVNNVLPFLGYTYRLSQTNRFNFKYSTSSEQPTINQLQPVPDNSNPNQVRLGNPDLLPSYSHNINISYNAYKPLSGRYVWININGYTTDKAFANDIAYDSKGRTLSKTVNVDGNYSGRLYLGAGLPFFSKKLEINPSANGGYDVYSSFINGKKNTTSTSSINTGLTIDVDLDTLNFIVSYNYDYNSPVSTISTASNKPYTEQQYNAELSLKLPYKFLIETDAMYKINSNRAEGYNINYVLWNASISKSFLKNENLIVTFSGNDLLNQNINTNRTISDNVITDNKTNVISRYFLLKLTYKFNSTKTKDKDEDW